MKRNRTAKKCGETAESEKKEKQSLLQKIKYTYQTMCDKIKVLLEEKRKINRVSCGAHSQSGMGAFEKRIVQNSSAFKTEEIYRRCAIWIGGSLRYGEDTGCAEYALSVLWRTYRYLSGFRISDFRRAPSD